MKKYLVLISVIAVVLFTVTAFAATTVEFNGDIRIRGEKNDNLTDFQKSDSNDAPCSSINECYDDNSWYEQRVRLGAKATISPSTFGVIELESGSGDVDSWTWEGVNTKRGSMDIRLAYIAHSFGKMATLQAGHMELALGNKLFFDHTQFADDAILLLVPAGPGNVMGLMIKLGEGNTGENDDAEAYVLGYSAPMGSVNFSGEVTHLRFHDKSIHDNGQKLTNIGLRADADLSGIMVKGDVEYQWGKLGSCDTCGIGGTGVDDIKFRGFAVMVGATIPAGTVSARANAAYGSGDKITSDDKYEGFVNFLSADEPNYTYIYEYKATAASGGLHTGLNNTWYLNAGVTAKPMTDLSLSGDVYFLRAAKKVSETEDSKAIGTEVDAKASYQLDTNLFYTIDAGYLFAGNLYKNVTGGENPDNPWSVRHTLRLTF